MITCASLGGLLLALAAVVERTVLRHHASAATREP